jgi:hypothetical protein
MTNYHALLHDPSSTICPSCALKSNLQRKSDLSSLPIPLINECHCPFRRFVDPPQQGTRRQRIYETHLQIDRSCADNNPRGTLAGLTTIPKNHLSGFRALDLTPKPDNKNNRPRLKRAEDGCKRKSTLLYYEPLTRSRASGRSYPGRLTFDETGYASMSSAGTGSASISSTSSGVVSGLSQRASASRLRMTGIRV